VAAHEPELPERGDERERGRRITVEEPFEGGSEVVALRRQALERGRLAGTVQLPVGGLGESEVVAGVRLSQRLGVRVAVELLRGELADRLQHPYAPARPPDEAPVEQRLEDVQVAFADLLERVECRPPGEDREPGEQVLFGLVEQVVRPGDRGSKGLLARIGVPIPAQPVEAPAEARQHLRGCKQACARGGELDCERQVVEARAELFDGCGLTRVVSERDRAGQEQLDRIDVFACEAKPLSARDDDLGPAGIAKGRDRRRCVG
jgi:hypothetical protein